MTSFRQIEANRRNARKSTGPITEEGKQRSRCNAVRHGLTAETVIGALEDAGDYQAFEAAIIADYDVQSAVERQLVLRLASLLWRLRRATTMETGLFAIHADHLSAFRQARQLNPASREVVHALFGRPDSVSFDRIPTLHGVTNGKEAVPSPGAKSGEAAVDPGADLTQCFLRLANLPNYPLDRLSRYEATLWRQVRQILSALDALDRRKPQERSRRFRFGNKTCWPTDATTIEPPNPLIYAIDAELGGDGQTSLRTLGIEIASNREWRPGTRITRRNADHSDPRVARKSDPQDRQHRQYYRRRRRLGVGTSGAGRGAYSSTAQTS